MQQRLQFRCVQMVLAWGSIGLSYSIGSLYAAFSGRPAWQVPFTALDAWFTTQSQGIWLYASLFLLVPYTFVMVSDTKLPALVRSMQVSALLCAVLFIAVPSTVQYPTIAGERWHHVVHRFLMAWDSTYNCFPSLHGVLLVLCVGALLDRHTPFRSALLIGYAVFQCAAILQLRRHGVIDLAVGLMLGAGIHLAMNRRTRSMSIGDKSCT